MKRTDSTQPIDATALFAAALLALILVGLPLAGAFLAGLPLDRLMEFPPHSRYIAHAPFSWPVFLGLAALIAAVVLSLVWRILRTQVSRATTELAAQSQAVAAAVSAAAARGTRAATGECGAAGRAFPWWGWCGLLFGLVAWGLAWTRMIWFEKLQSFTFSPLWVAYIVVVSALTWRRSGRCLLTERPARLLLLAAASAVFWWYFEYLNRFVQNWMYAGVGNLSAIQYIFIATPAFATVLPAVAGTEELLATFPRLTAGLAGFHPARLAPAAGVALCAVGASSLFLLPFFPNALFPLLWVAPALLLAGVSVWRGRPCVLDGLATGDWSRLVRLALAALVCGFFWEMWNCWSFAAWRYSVPYVNRFHLFEMPLLGYAGYLPFGIECALVADALLGRHSSDRKVETATLS